MNPASQHRFPSPWLCCVSDGRDVLLLMLDSSTVSRAVRRTGWTPLRIVSHSFCWNPCELQEMAAWALRKCHQLPSTIPCNWIGTARQAGTRCSSRLRQAMGLPIGDHTSSILSVETITHLTVLGFNIGNRSGGLARYVCTEGVIALL